MFIFDLQGGMAHNDHSFEGVPVGPFVFPQQGLLGFFAAGPGMGHYFGMNKAAADDDTTLGGHRFLGRTEHHFRPTCISHLGDRLPSHDFLLRDFEIYWYFSYGFPRIILQ